MNRYLILAFLLFPSFAFAQPGEPAEEFPGLKLELVFAEKSFELGTPIEVVMRYTYTGDVPRLGVWHIGYDRSGRVPEYGFTAVDSEGGPVADPIADSLGGFGGGMRTAGPLDTGRPYEQTVTVNEWLRFDRPGRYRIVGHSEIVCPDTEESGSAEGYPIPLASAPVEIEILPADDAGRLARIGKAREQLASEDEEERFFAARDLRFMVDARAIPLLVPHLSDPFGNVAVEARFGLLSYADLSPVKAAVAAYLEAGKEVPAEDVYTYADILARADVQAASIGGGWDSDEWSDAYYEHLARWKGVIAKRLRREIENLPPAEAVKILVDGMALGSVYPRDDTEIWKFVLSNLGCILDGSVRARAEHLIEELRLKAFLPELKKAAENAALDGRLRSAAILAVHEMGEDPFLDLIAADLVSDSPRLTAEAHGTLGQHRAVEIGEKLLALFLGAEGEARRAVAERIRDFGGAIPAEGLLEALAVSRGEETRGEGWFPLLAALALKSPSHATPFLEAFFDRPVELRGGAQWNHLRLLVRVDTPGAQVLVRDLLLAPESSDRVETLNELQQALQDQSPPGSPRRFPGARLAERFFPEIMLLFKGDPEARVRVAAQRLLAEMTGIPEEGIWGETTEAALPWAPRWQGWWEVNGARFGRWGRARHGIAMRVTLQKGEFDGEEPIPATVRFWRTGGDRASPKGIALRVYFVPSGGGEEEVHFRSEPIPLPKAAQLPPEDGSVVEADLNLRDAGVFGEPGTYRVCVRIALDGPSQKTNWAERDLVIAHPVTIRVR